MSVEVSPIRTEADYQAALAEVERLWGAAAGTPDRDRLDVLFDLVEAYERFNCAEPLFPPPDDPIDAIRLALEAQGLDETALAPMIGSPGLAAQVLAGERPLTLEMIRRLHDGLGISAEVLIRPGRAEARRSAAAE